jgi:hypothetical protein
MIGSNATRYQPARTPTLYFIGVTTGQSSIMTVFPAWARHLGLSDAAIQGIDFPLHANPAAYREAVAFIKTDPLSTGALVTTHKTRSPPGLRWTASSLPITLRKPGRRFSLSVPAAPPSRSPGT